MELGWVLLCLIYQREIYVQITAYAAGYLFNCDWEISSQCKLQIFFQIIMRKITLIKLSNPRWSAQETNISMYISLTEQSSKKNLCREDYPPPPSNESNLWFEYRSGGEGKTSFYCVLQCWGLSSRLLYRPVKIPHTKLLFSPKS